MHAPKRPTAPRQAKPAQRYFRGKAPRGVTAASDSEESSSEEVNEVQLEEGDVPLSGDQAISGDEGDEGAGDGARRDSVAAATAATAGLAAKNMNVSLRNVNITDGKVIVDGRAESGRTAMEESASEGEGAASPQPLGIATEGGEESSSEYESESEEGEKAIPLFRPVFVPKRARVTVQEREAGSQDTEEAQVKREAEAERRKQESHDLVAESIKRELAEQEVQEIIPDVDDTDGLDPATEFEEWRLRELSRIKRDKEAQLKREEEREEIERRRALPEEQRLAEDLEHAKKSREEKPKGKQMFLQKYHHKGAFHQDTEIVKRRDFTEATESTVDVSLLPKVMQVKNFGKRSRTKYTHLLDQDTTREAKPSWMQGQKNQKECFNCGGPHLAHDCPNRDESSRGPGSGANGSHVTASTGRQWGVRKDAVPLPSIVNGDKTDGERRHWKDHNTDDGYRQRRDNQKQDAYRGRDGPHYDKRPSRSGTFRSQSPQRRRPRSRSPIDETRRYSSHRRPRSRSPSLDRYDKRRRRD